MTDYLDLRAAMIVKSPDVATWPAALRITRVTCTPAGGFVVAFDRPVPEAWKWPSNPAVPSENYQWTFWWFKRIGSLWFGAGLVQMWQGREQGTRALPPLFADVDGAPGWTRLWGEGSKWPDMTGTPPRDGETMGIMVSAGNARQTPGITSVAERSNIVPWTVRADDSGDVTYPADGVPVVEPPPSQPPTLPPSVDVGAALAAILTKLNDLEVALLQVQAATYVGTLDLPKGRWLSAGSTITLTPKGTP